MTRTFPLSLGLAAVLVLGLGFAAQANQGVLEINATCAINTGCFAGDSPGYPVQITPAAPAKSFVLTSDLAVSSASTTAIEIARTNVTLDLQGFEIACRVPPFNVPCTSNPNATAFEGGDGVRVFSTSVSFVEIRNGTISSMGDDGTELGPNALVRNVRASGNFVSGNAGTGIRMLLDGIFAVLGVAQDNFVIGPGASISGGFVGPGNYCGASGC